MFFMLLPNKKYFLCVPSEILEDVELIDWLVDVELVMVAKWLKFQWIPSEPKIG